MSRAKPMHWEPGVADEAWKVLINGRDLHRIDDAVACLYAAIVGGWVPDASSPEARTRREIAALAEFSGEELARALTAYRAKLVQGVRNGLREAAE